MCPKGILVLSGSTHDSPLVYFTSPRRGNIVSTSHSSHGSSVCMGIQLRNIFSAREHKVAVKVIDTNKINQEYVIKNLTREAKLLSMLHHQNIVKLYETIQDARAMLLVVGAVLLCLHQPTSRDSLRAQKEHFLPTLRMTSTMYNDECVVSLAFIISSFSL
uniref:Protein kinase domain-containing protein n=1 Tax=Trichogramma kaykai TaxID=54128 RepID=A0ABD2X1C4_9HYME